MIESAKHTPLKNRAETGTKTDRTNRRARKQRATAHCILATLLLLPAPGLIAQDSVYDGERTGDQREGSAESPDETNPPREEPIAWMDGPGEARIGEWAALNIPEGYRFAGEDDAYLAQGEDRFYRRDGHSLEYGLIRPAGPDARWYLLFSFDDWGFFKRDGDRELSAALVRRSYETDFAYANEWRFPDENNRITFAGWKIEPRFTPNGGAEWAAVYREGDVEIVEYVRAFPGRDGCLRATSAFKADTFETILPALRAILSGVRFQNGRAYADFVPNDAISFVSLNEYLEDDIWTDERGGLHSLFAWVEKFISVYSLDSPERWLESDHAADNALPSPEGAPGTEPEAEGESPSAWLDRYWYLPLIPLGLFVLWKFDSRRGPKTQRYGRQ